MIALKNRVIYWARFFTIILAFAVWISSCTTNVRHAHVNSTLPMNQVARIWIGAYALRITNCDGRGVLGSLRSLRVIPGEHILMGWVNDELNYAYTETFTLKFNTEAGHNYSVRYKEQMSLGKYVVYITDDTTGKAVTLIPNPEAVLAKLADIEKKLQERPQNYDLWTQKGILLRQLKRNEVALSAFDTATQMSTNPAVAWKQKSEVLVELKRYDEALTAITRAILAFPRNEEYYLAKKEIERLRNKESYEEEVRAAYGEVLSIDSSTLVMQHSSRPAVKREYDLSGTNISTIKAGDTVYIEYLDGKPRILKAIERQ